MIDRFTDLASEKGLVGSLIVNPYSFIEISDLVKLEMFTNPLCREVMYELTSLYDEGKEADIVLISDNLVKRSLPFTFDDVSELLNYVNSELIREYANKIKEAYFSRQLTERLSDGLKGISSGENILKVMNKIDHLKENILEGLQDERNDHVSALAKDSLDIVHLAREKKGLIGMDTGSEKINDHFGGWQQNRVITIAGRPAMGKTTLCLNWCLSAAKNDNPVLIMSLEVSREMMILTLACIISGINTDKALKGELSDEEFDKIVDAHSQITELPIYIIDNVYAIDEILSKARFYAKKHGVKMMMLDYLQLVSGRGDTRHLQVESIMKGLKKLAKKTDANLCIMNLSQLSRAVETRGGDKRPMLSDLKESGSIEEGSDIVGFIYRPEYYGILEDDEGQSLKGITELIFAKNKWGGIGTIKQRMVNRNFVDLVEPTFDEIDDSILQSMPTNDNQYQPMLNIQEENNAMANARPNQDDDIPF